MPLYRALYVSRSRLPAEERDAFERLVSAAAARNAVNAVSGALAVENGTFLQVLEGERETVMGLLAKIAADTRHDAMTVIDARPARFRLYDTWGMIAARPGAAAADPASFSALCELSAKAFYRRLAGFQRTDTGAPALPLEVGDVVYL